MAPHARTRALSLNNARELDGRPRLRRGRRPGDPAGRAGGRGRAGPAAGQAARLQGGGVHVEEVAQRTGTGGAKQGVCVRGERAHRPRSHLFYLDTARARPHTHAPCPPRRKARPGVCTPEPLHPPLCKGFVTGALCGHPDNNNSSSRSIDARALPCNAHRPPPLAPHPGRGVCGGRPVRVWAGPGGSDGLGRRHTEARGGAGRGTEGGHLRASNLDPSLSLPTASSASLSPPWPAHAGSLCPSSRWACCPRAGCG